MKILFFIFCFILFCPIPLKFTLYYSLENYYLKFYKFIIISKHKNIRSKKIKLLIKHNEKKKSKFNISRYKSFFPKIFYSKFKPSLKIELNFSYSLNNAFYTALAYGSLSTIYPFLYQLIKIPFRIKKHTLNISPIFKDEFLVKFEISSIIFISFAQIIYMLIIFIKVSKEGNP